jgi:hypothetical protein
MSSKAGKSSIKEKGAPFLLRRDDARVLFLYVVMPMVERLLIAFGTSSSLICLIGINKEK